MNKNFLSRGKRKDTRKWVTGYLIEQNDPEYHAYIIKSFKADIDNRYVDILECDIEEVIPETVGRCTSLTYKNGTRIFEGDIIKYFDIEYQKYFIGIVYYCNAAFWIDSDDENDKDDGKSFVQIGNIPNEYIEVIGNIHDNPELIGGTV